MTKQTNTQADNSAVFASLDKLTVGIQVRDDAENTMATANEMIKTAWDEIRKANVTIGDLRKCAVAQYFRDSMLKLTSPKTNKPYNLQSIKNMLSDMRYALSNNKPLEWNPNRDNAKNKASEAPKSASTKNSVDPKSRKASKAKTTEGAKTIVEKLEVQIENCISILQSIDEGDVVEFDVDAVNQLLCDLQAEIA